MNYNMHEKGGPFYHMTRKLLESYLEMKYFNEIRDVETYEEPRYSIRNLLAYANPLAENSGRKSELGYSCTFASALCQVMEETLKELALRNPCYSDILKRCYFTREYYGISLRKRIDTTGLAAGSYYRPVYKSIEQYSGMLWRHLEEREDMPFSRDLSVNQKVLGYLEDTEEMHLPGGRCFEDTLSILKSYTRVKYNNIYSEITESVLSVNEYIPAFIRNNADFDSMLDSIGYSKAPAVIRGWMASSMMETTGAYIIYIDRVLEMLKAFGPQGADCYQLLEVSFLDPEYQKYSWQHKLQSLSMSHRVYYVRRQEAITMLSKILWGRLAHRHPDSIFHREMKNPA